MATVAEEFITKFHSLEGTTISQRKKSLFVLLHQNQSLKGNEEVLDIISTTLKPRTFLEELFKLEFLIYFRRSKELFQLLKEGNDVFISKITKQTWFFQHSFNHIEAQELVNEILPSMSYSVRSKVLRKLSRYLNSGKFDNIFDAVTERYGIFISCQFITGCTPDKIKTVLRDHSIKLNYKQLTILYEKDSALVEFYFTIRCYSVVSYTYRKFLKFLFIKNPILYKVLEEKLRLKKLRFGRRLTKKMFVHERDQIVNNPHDFSSLYDMKVIIRKLGKDSVQLFCNSLPPFKIIMTGLTSHTELRSWFDKKYHYNLVFQVIPNYYNIRYVDYPDLIRPEILDLEPDKEKRAILAKVKVDEGDDDYIKYLTIEQSIPLLKEKINLTSDINARRKLILDLISSCNINNDLTAFHQIMKYFITRHKSDDVSVLAPFISKLENTFNLADFTEEMWNDYYEILMIYTLKHNTDIDTHKNLQTRSLAKFFVGNSIHQKFSYLHFLFKNNKSLDEMMSEFFKEEIQFPKWGAYSKDFEKYVLMYIINYAKQQYKCEEETISFNSVLLEKIKSWNMHYTEDQLNFYDFPFLTDSFNYIIKKWEHVTGYKKETFRSKIFTTSCNEYKKEYLQIYWDRLSVFRESVDFFWFLKYEPTIIDRYYDTFLQNAIAESQPSSGRSGRRRYRYSRSRPSRSSHLAIWYEIKKYTHLGFDVKSIQYCLSKINTENCEDYKPQYITCLSVLMKPERYAELADSFKPTSKTVNLQEEKDTAKFTLQCSIAENFKNTKSYSVLPSLFNYCVGDYFHHSMRSLYSIIYRTPEILLSKHLNYLAKKAVSVRKHALYFTCELTSVEQVENMLQLLNKSEGVVSLQKYMFSSSIKYFLKNPLDKFFEVVKSNLLLITKEDRESHEMIVDKCSEIPLQYKTQYILHAWEHFEKIIEIPKDLLNAKGGLLRRMMDDYVIKAIPFEFGLRIIREHFPSGKLTRLANIFEFALCFLIARDEKSIILDSVLSIIEDREKPEEQFSFFHQWYKLILKSEENDLKFLEPFVHYFEKKITSVEHFKDYFKIFFLKMKLELGNNYSLIKFTLKVSEFLENLIITYGPHIVYVMSNELEDGLQLFKQDTYDFCQNLIENHQNRDIAVLVLQIITKPSKWRLDELTKYNAIIGKIRAMQDPLVQIILQCGRHSD